jgi:hypothetical protein
MEAGGSGGAKAVRLAERRLGAMLAKWSPGPGRLQKGNAMLPFLKEHGITKMQSSCWQAEARVLKKNRGTPRGTAASAVVSPKGQRRPFSGYPRGGRLSGVLSVFAPVGRSA